MPVQTRINNKRNLPPNATAGKPPCKKMAGSRNAAIENVTAANNEPQTATEPDAPVMELVVQMMEQDAPTIEPEASSNETHAPMPETEAPTIVAEALPIVTEVPLIEAAYETVPLPLEAGNADPLPEGETIEDNVEAPQIVVDTFCANDVFAEITNDTSAYVFAYNLTDTLSEMHWNINAWWSFVISVDKVVKAYNCALAKNIAQHIKESIATKMHMLFVERFFAEHGIASAAEAEDNYEAIAPCFEAELRGKVRNAYQSAIDEATNIKTFRAAMAKYVAAFQDVCRPLNASKYKIYELVIARQSVPTNDLRVVEVAGLMRQNVTDSARLHGIGTEMVRLVKEKVESNGLEDTLREIRDALVAELEGESPEQTESFVGAFQKMAAPLVDWMRKKR